MIDPAISALFHNLDALTGRGLWLADENVEPMKLSNLTLDLVSNRYDLVTSFNALNQKNEQVTAALHDFDLEKIEQGAYDYVLLRAPKSKILQHYLVNVAQMALKPAGKIIVTGNNDEGIKSLIKNLEKWCAGHAEGELLGKGLRYAAITVGDAAEFETPKRAAEYNVIHTLETENGIQFTSKPGVYGFDKIDSGSAFLIETLTKTKAPIKGNVVDLGAGYGYLSVMLKAHFEFDSIIATDNNITAITCCEQNFAQNGVEGEVLIDDCGSTILDRSAHVVISNPPFHQGFSTSTELTEKFVNRAKALLKFKGVAYFVVNRFIGIEEWIEKAGLKSECLAQNGQFKVLVMRI